MQKLFFGALLFVIFSKQIAQLPFVYLKQKQCLAFGNMTKNATLFVVIENEKNADDAALIEALKSHWKIGQVKYLSGLEFSEKFKSNSLDESNLYLFNNFTRPLRADKPIISVMIYQGYYLTNSPVKLANSTKAKNAPAYLYFSADVLYDKKRVPNKGFYSLMVKNFNHDVLFCQDETNFKSKKKKRRKNGVYFFKTDSINERTVLLVKEQTQKKEKTTKQGERKTSNVSGKKIGMDTDKYTDSKKAIVVFPEDIEYAVKTNDRNIMLYNGGCLYSAEDGSVYATMRKSPPTYWKPLVYNLVSLAASTIFIISIKNRTK